MSKIYFHIDVNNAFLSWEAIKRLKEGETTDLRTICSAVAGDPKNRTGIILAKSKLAKDMGVKTGEPIFSAIQKCPDLICVPPNHDYYEKESLKLKKLLQDFSDEVIPYSIDECFITYIPLLGKVTEVANNIKERIFNELGYTVNIGISDKKYLAKVASDFEKPNKIHTLYTTEIKEKFWPLPIENMFLLGNKTARKLKALGIDTVYKLANTDINILRAHLKSQGEDLYNYAWGKDIDERHQKGETPKSIGHSKTSAYDLTDLTNIFSFILDIVQNTCNRLRNENMKANTITLTLKTSNFKIYSMAQTLSFPTNGTNEIFKNCKNIFNKMYKGEPLRLIGISLSNLVPDETTQLNIFESFNEKEYSLDTTVDNLIKKFGNNYITRASLINNSNKNKKH